MVPLRETMIRLDFLAQSVVPYARSSFYRTFTFKSPMMELPFYSHAAIDVEPLDNSNSPDSIPVQHLRLLRLIAAHNDMDKIVWSSFYGEDEQPKRNQLLSFRAELLLWRQCSHETFANYEQSLSCDFSSLSSRAMLHELPIPPQPLELLSHSAAVAVAYYNCYLACTLSMLAATETDPVVRDARESEAFACTYDNLRLAAGALLPMSPSHKPASPVPSWCSHLDPSLTIPLFLGARRTFAPTWRHWTIETLRTLGRTGLCDGHALANCLAVLPQIDAHNFRSIPRPPRDTTFSPSGRLNGRTIPILMPPYNDSTVEAFYLRHNREFSGVIAKAKWRQADEGVAEGLRIEFFDGQGRLEDDAEAGARPAEETRDVLENWRTCVEDGWHTFIHSFG